MSLGSFALAPLLSPQLKMKRKPGRLRPPGEYFVPAGQGEGGKLMFRTDFPLLRNIRQYQRHRRSFSNKEN